MKINFENENNNTRILVCGGRHFNEYHYLELALNNIIENYNYEKLKKNRERNFLK